MELQQIPWRIKFCMLIARLSMVLDFAFIVVYLFYFLVYTVCTILNMMNYAESQSVAKSLFFPKWQTFDSLNQSMCMQYINRIMMLLIVDILVLLIKSYLAMETLLAAKYKPK